MRSREPSSMPAGIFSLMREGFSTRPSPLALRGRAFDDLAGAAAARAGLRDLEKSAGTDDLAAPAAVAAGTRASRLPHRCPWQRSHSSELRDLDLLVATKGRLLEPDLHVVAQIRAALFAVAIGRRWPLPAEELLEDSASATTAAAEDLAENIERIVHAARAGTAAPCAKAAWPKAIVGRALSLVHQDVVGLAELLEFLLGRVIARIFVRVKLDRELAVGALDFVRL